MVRRACLHAVAVGHQLRELLDVGTARFSSPLGVYDFQKRSSLIEVSEAGAQTLGTIAAELAYGEGLQAHARAAELRLTEVPPMRAAK